MKLSLTRIRAWSTRLLPLLPVVVTATVLYLVPPETIVGCIGTGNAYVFIFVLSFFGGLTTFSGIPYHLVLISLATGGLNPYLLGITTALAVSLGDCLTYYLGYIGRPALSGRLLSLVELIASFSKNHPRLTPFVIFLYGSLVPYSSDVVTIPMGLARYPIARVIIPLGIGTALFNTALAYTAAHAFGWLQPFI